MKIESYEFGEVKVAGKTYTSDLIISPSKLVHPWRRREGHGLELEDLREILEADIDYLIIGTGYYGVMKVPKSLIEKLEARGLIVSVKPTKEAWKLYNRLLDEGRKVAAALHLTC